MLKDSIWIVTDLDGTLMDHNYDIEPAIKTLKWIIKEGINFRFIDLGGGMGISYSNKEKEINLKKYAKLIQKFMKNNHF